MYAGDVVVGCADDMKTVMGSTPASVVSDVGAALYDTELKLLGSLEDIFYSVWMSKIFALEILGHFGTWKKKQIWSIIPW